MRASTGVKKITNNKWISPIIILIIAICIESFLGNYLFYLSHDYIIKTQDFLNEKLGLTLFDNKVEKVSPSPEGKVSFPKNGDDPISRIDDFVSQVNGNIIFSEVMHFFNTNIFFLIVCAFLYNFVNVYKIFVLTTSIFLGNFISSTLAFIYHTPRPFMVYYSIKPVFMTNDWGSPDTQMVILVSFALVLFKITVKTEKMMNNTIGKILIGLLITIVVLADIFVIFASGNIAFNQIIFSILIAIVVYQFLFLLLKAKVNKAEQLYKFMKIKTVYYIVVNLLLLTFEIILYIFVIDKNDVAYYTDTINIQQQRLPYSEFLNNNFNYRRFFYLNKGNFCNIICFLMNIVSFLSLKAELNWTYKGDYDRWSSNNFELPRVDEVNIEFSNYNEFNSNDGTQWNHNGVCKSLIRFILIIILSLVCMLPSVIIYNSIEATEKNGFIFIMTLPFALLVFGIFFFFKKIFRFFKLAKNVV